MNLAEEAEAKLGLALMRLRAALDSQRVVASKPDPSARETGLPEVFPEFEEEMSDWFKGIRRLLRLE
jgi:hypothetical protein